MELLNTLKEAEKELFQGSTFDNTLILTTKKTIIKASFLNIDLYSDSLIYTWLDKNRVKFSIDGAKNKFLVKKNTKFYSRDSNFADLPDHILTQKELENGDGTELMKHIENQFKNELKEYFDVYGFVIDQRKIIFYIKDKRDKRRDG